MTFELVIDDRLTAAENMRRDELLLARARPIVRLYGWAPEAVSLGRSQTDAAIDLDVVRALGLDVVARGTGGGDLGRDALCSRRCSAPIWPRSAPGSRA